MNINNSLKKFLWDQTMFNTNNKIWMGSNLPRRTDLGFQFVGCGFFPSYGFWQETRFRMFPSEDKHQITEFMLNIHHVVSKP